MSKEIFAVVSGEIPEVVLKEPCWNFLSIQGLLKIPCRSGKVLGRSVQFLKVWEEIHLTFSKNSSSKNQWGNFWKKVIEGISKVIPGKTGESSPGTPRNISRKYPLQVSRNKALEKLLRVPRWNFGKNIGRMAKINPKMNAWSNPWNFWRNPCKNFYKRRLKTFSSNF